jgi:hypothetical protein
MFIFIILIIFLQVIIVVTYNLIWLCFKRVVKRDVIRWEVKWVSLTLPDTSCFFVLLCSWKNIRKFHKFMINDVDKCVQNCTKLNIEKVGRTDVLMNFIDIALILREFLILFRIDIIIWNTILTWLVFVSNCAKCEKWDRIYNCGGEKWNGNIVVSFTHFCRTRLCTWTEFQTWGENE